MTSSVSTQLRTFLLERPEPEIQAILPGLSSDVIACAVKLLTNAELTAVSAKVFHPLPGTHLGARGYLSARLQPNSPTDDLEDIRWQVFDAVYGNAFLSRYAHGGGLLWGHRHPFRAGLLGPFGMFPGEQPIGSYPIHVVVERGRVRLLGMVDTEADKTAAGLAARGVPGTFGVQNDLVVERPATETSR